MLPLTASIVGYVIFCVPARQCVNVPGAASVAAGRAITRRMTYDHQFWSLVGCVASLLSAGPVSLPVRLSVSLYVSISLFLSLSLR